VCKHHQPQRQRRRILGGGGGGGGGGEERSRPERGVEDAAHDDAVVCKNLSGGGVAVRVRGPTDPPLDTDAGDRVVRAQRDGCSGIKWCARASSTTPACHEGVGRLHQRPYEEEWRCRNKRAQKAHHRPAACVDGVDRLAQAGHRHLEVRVVPQTLGQLQFDPARRFIPRKWRSKPFAGPKVTRHRYTVRDPAGL